jgi:meso-butanediol dehydrogenase/(S,S)-butanediol dehydrogenase/diacetyl reductase
MKLEGKVAIITGAGAGIGEATALLFAKEGARVCCNSKSESALKVVEKIEDSGGHAFFSRGDVSVVEDAKRITDETVQRYGKLDILFNNAGIVILGRVDNTSPEDWDQTMAVNVRGPYLVSKFAVPYLKKTKGCIINNASVVALKGVKDRGPYAASKGAVLSMTRAMARDYIEDGVRVNCISPGTIETPSLAERLSQFEDPDAARVQFIARQPMGRFGTPGEIAEGVLYLALAEFCTGMNLSVDGGMTM